MRPRPAAWFELLTTREELGAVLDCLAHSGMVELETYSDVSQPQWLPHMQSVVEKYQALADQYSQYWPTPVLSGQHPTDADTESGQLLIAQLEGWARDAEPVVLQMQQLQTDATCLALLRDWLSTVPAGCLPDLERLAGAGPLVGTRLYVLPSGTWPASAGAGVLLHKTSGREHGFLLALGREEQLEQLDQSVAALSGRSLALPDWLAGDRDAALEGIEGRAGELVSQRDALEKQLLSLGETHALSRLLARMQFLSWVADQVPQLAVTEHFAWVTGWTSDLGGEALRQKLEQAGLNHLIRFPPAPARSVSPMVLKNPAWARPFELFASLLGTPAAGEADPSLLVAFIAPLLFGYMFGDLGQGAVLCGLGLALRRQYPSLRLLIPGGLVAMVFGLLSGSVFSYEGLFPPLWLHPMEQPLVVLGASLAFGALILSLGVTLDAVQAHWNGRAGQWWRQRGGLALSYFSVLGAALEPGIAWLALVGLAWHLAGHGQGHARGMAERLGASLAEFGETLLQMLVNTVSFVRVGAFALAHSGLSLAITGIAATVDNVPGTVLVFVVGNLFVLTLEALVVGIQATRLILFEFFIRFLKAEGRAFRPLIAPDAPPKSPKRRPS